MGAYAVVRGAPLAPPGDLADRELEVELCVDGESIARGSLQGQGTFEVLASLATSSRDSVGGSKRDAR